jgi:protein-disulfide isomerase
LLGLAVLIIVLAGVLVWLAAFRESGPSGLSAKLAAAEATFPYDMAKGTTVGKADAPLKLVAYEDFQCPFCLRYTGNEEPTLIEEYVKTGKMSLTFKHLPLLGFESTRAALASQCAANQDKFWQYHAKLFKTQADAGQDTAEKTNVGRFDEDKLNEMASSLGLDTAAFSQCLATDQSLQAVQDSNREAQTLGLNGTPSFTLNGQSIGSGTLALDDFRKTLDQAYSRLTGSPSPTASVSPSPSASSSPAPSGTPAAGASTSPTAAVTATPTR